MSQPTPRNLLSKLKVCGLTKLDQIQELISMNADFLGFIFYEKSPRFVLNHLSLHDISQIDHPGKVGVFVNEEIEKIIEIVEQGKLNLIQLHGDEDDHFIFELKKQLPPEIKIIKVIRIGNDSIENKNKIKQIFSTPTTSLSYYLFDTDSKAFGGTGKQFDWHILNELNIPLPYFLSGGISEENIGAVEYLSHQPFALDINSKFERSPGDKDIDGIKKFKNSLHKSPEGTI